MRLGRVVGSVAGTIKDRSLTGHRLLIVDLVDPDGTVVDSGLVALDAVGAGEGDTVLVASGSSARQAERTMGTPADLAAVLIVDEVIIKGGKVGPTATTKKKKKE